jgi:spore coat polysaccharide biosynthesis predicted glycosyltransferase SpsG
LSSINPDFIGKRILIRCDGSTEIGFGHVVRCLALADELSNEHGFQVEFAMPMGPMCVEQVQDKGYLVHLLEVEPLGIINEGQWLESLVCDTDTQALVLDVRSDLSIEAIERIRLGGVLIITIDDASNRRIAADLAFYPPVPQVERLDWCGFTGERFVGWDWVLVRPEFARCRRKLDRLVVEGNAEPQNPVPASVLLTMGGSDPAGLTLKALQALDQIEQELSVLVVLGRGYMQQLKLEEWLKQARRSYHLHFDVQDMAALMANADLAITSFGVTAYELAAMGVPSIYYCLSEDHCASASAFVEAGIAINLGQHTQVSERNAIEAIESMIKEIHLRFNIKDVAFESIDGRGIQRISSLIGTRLSEINPTTDFIKNETF